MKTKDKIGKTDSGTESGTIGRREFLRLVGCGAAAGIGLPLMSCGTGSSTTKKKVIVLGLDGLDPNIIKRLIDEGRAPNFSKLWRMGSFMKLRTTMPALSPVAWSSFITGLTPGGHGIADFIMRDPKTYSPVFSIYETREADIVINIGDIQLPLTGGGAYNLRRGTPFWSYLTERGIPAVVIKIPTNFPPDESATRAVSGMGTPDVTDAYGMFAYYSSDFLESYPDLSGGRMFYVDVIDWTVESVLPGPEDALHAPRDTSEDEYANKVKVPFKAWLDPEHDLARIDIQGKQVLLQKGEFSDWVRLNFEMLPLLGNVSGIVRFLLKEVHPHFKLYVTPINIDPVHQAMPVTVPSGYGADLAREIGLFATKGLPGDTKAFDHKIFSDEDYVAQAGTIWQERLAMFDYEWSRFDSGLLYFYVSNTDQDAHMLWRNMDETHPMHRESDLRFKDYIYHLYEEMDKLVGRVLPAVDDDSLLLICSDHGFAPYGRQFHLNTWLKQRGYLVHKEGAQGKFEASVHDIDWSRTVAYGVGFNGLYINLKGREAEGIVEPGEETKYIDGITRELEALADPETGMKPVAKVYRREEMYSGELTPEMPEMLVGYTPGYRCSGSSVLGGSVNRVIELNPWAWSGDHSMARDLVPGSLFSSKPVRTGAPSILDLPVSILDYFEIPKPEQMVGRSIFAA